MGVLWVCSPSCSGDNGMGNNVKYSPDFLSLLDPEIKPENLKVRVLEVSKDSWPTISKSFIKHRFVTVKLCCDNQIFYATAELSRNGKSGVIEIWITREARTGVENEFGLKLYEENASLSEVIAVLVDHSSDYNIWRDNCYQYADNMFRKVVKTFGIEVAPSKKIAKALQRALDDHPRPVLPKDVLKKRYFAGAAAGVAVTTTAVTAAAVVCLPFTLIGLYPAPVTLSVAGGAISLSGGVFGVGCMVKKADQCLDEATV